MPIAFTESFARGSLALLSFLVTTPGVWAVVEGFPAPASAGGFLIKDLFLLGE